MSSCDAELLDRARQHVRDALTVMTQEAFAGAAGVHQATIWGLGKGRPVSARTARLVLAVPIPTEPQRTVWVDTTEVRAHLDRLTQYLTCPDVAARAGVPLPRIARLRYARPSRVMQESDAKAILAVPVPTDRPPQSRVTRVRSGRGRRPDRVDPIKVDRAVAGGIPWAGLTRAEKTAAISHLIRTEQLNDRQIGMRLRVGGSDPRDVVCQHRLRERIAPGWPKYSHPTPPRRGEMTAIAATAAGAGATGKALPPHGTPQRYRLEVDAGQTPCDLCKAGERTYRAGLRAANPLGGGATGQTLANTLPPWFQHDERAGCRTRMSSLFFPEDADGNKIHGADAYRRAKAICDGCPLKVDCDEYAIPISNLDGMWGGRTASQRERERARRAAAAAAGNVPATPTLLRPPPPPRRLSVAELTAGMADPVRCGTCSHIYDLATAPVLADGPDVTVWRAPCCGTVTNSRTSPRRITVPRPATVEPPASPVLAVAA